jgi:rhodanese-related sulfurtransferase
MIKESEMITMDAPPETPSKATVHDVDVQTLRAWLEAGEAMLVDVREVDEHLNERIDGAMLMPLSAFDPSSVPPENGRRIVLQCRSGDRSRRAALRLLAAGRPEAYHLEGGIMAWKGASLPTVSTRVPITIARQVQVTVGVLVLATVALGVLVSPWWLAATAFFGCGLTFAGVTDKCPLAALIAQMPWNRAFRTSQPGATSSGCCAGGSTSHPQ